jgi:hypothetical protein
MHVNQDTNLESLLSEKIRFVLMQSPLAFGCRHSNYDSVVYRKHETFRGRKSLRGVLNRRYEFSLDCGYMEQFEGWVDDIYVSLPEKQLRSGVGLKVLQRGKIV